jgi:hypothetical protein
MDELLPGELANKVIAKSAAGKRKASVTGLYHFSGLSDIHIKNCPDGDVVAAFQYYDIISIVHHI